MKIEKEIYAIEKCWSTTELDVREYKKDGAVRGHVLGAAEEINLQLEDHLLNLQTMSGSRFVGRYAQKVRTWEKTLNMVVETLDVWYNVQRKWMYLESIFIGADSVLKLNFLRAPRHDHTRALSFPRRLRRYKNAAPGGGQKIRQDQQGI